MFAFIDIYGIWVVSEAKEGLMGLKSIRDAMACYVQRSIIYKKGSPFTLYQ